MTCIKIVQVQFIAIGDEVDYKLGASACSDHSHLQLDAPVIHRNDILQALDTYRSSRRIFGASYIKTLSQLGTGPLCLFFTTMHSLKITKVVYFVLS